MASIIETTAVALRKGDSASNQNFTGILAELVADLGVDGTGTDINTTLRLHNGVVEGGIPMCRADLANISTSQLASGRENIGLANEKNLAYADLSNLEVLTDSTAIATVLNILSGYGLAKVTYVDEQIATRAKYDMSNVDTADLATEGHGHAGKNLAYADTSNINTADLVSSIIHDGTANNKPLSYYDFTNADTSNLVIENGTAAGPVLAKKDLTNIAGTDINTLLFGTYKSLLNIEQTTNKITDVYARTLADQYPTANAVVNYVQNEFEQGGFMRDDLHNASTFDPLYSNKGINPEGSTVIPNNSFSYKYLVGEQGIITAGSGFEEDYIYSNDFVVDTGDTKSDLLKVRITEVSEQGLPVSLEFYQSHGVDDLSSLSPVQIQDSDGKLVTINFTSNPAAKTGYYDYVVTSFTTTETEANFTEENLYDLVNPIVLKQLLWVKVLSTDDAGAITACEFVPYLSNKFIESTDFENVEISSGTATASISINCYSYLPIIGGAGLVKTDLSNLLGMTDAEAEAEKGRPWRAIYDEDIPNVTETTIPEIKQVTLASQGKVWEALRKTYEEVANNLGIAAWKEGTVYVTSPKPTIVYYNGSLYYCKEAHTAGSTFDPTKWTIVSSSTFELLANKKTNVADNETSDTFYPSCKATATYVKDQIAAISLPDHYKGQVDNLFDDETSLPTSPAEGYAAFLRSYQSSTYPYVAIYTEGAWEYIQFTSGKDIENGNFVYCLDLGATYENAPGNITWNNTYKILDISPDKYLRPDNTSITLNTNGQLQIESTIKANIDTIPTLSNKVDALEIALGGAAIPSPEFFTGTNTVGQELTILEDVAFDLYVNGVFQYPNTYTFTKATKKITLNFAVQNTVANGIAVIYKGLKLGTAS